jgi:microsomal epoxide hydrolase
MKALAAYWTSAFDWRRAEANLNRYPQFLARVEDFDIHFYHVKGRGPSPLPLVLTHGWPGSVFEFLEAIGPLSDPARFGGSPEDAFDVVVPSLPGFGFSSKPKGSPVGPPTTARLWHKLMTEVLGYRRFGAQGGDWGNAVTVQLAREYPPALAGIHLNGAGAADDRSPARGRVNVPTGFASFPKEMPVLNPPRSLLAQAFNLVHYTRMPRGGHFACLEQPQLLVEDVRLFFRKLRG